MENVTLPLASRSSRAFPTSTVRMSAVSFRPVRSMRVVLALVGVLATACEPRPAAGRGGAGAVERRRGADVVTLARADGVPTHDDYGVAIAYGIPARRIVSLNPTTTELLFALGAGAQVAGRSRWDQWPTEARALPEVGDAIRPSVERVVALRPDLVLLYASGDNRAAAQAMASAGLRVVSLRVDRIADLERCVRVLGALTGRGEVAEASLDTLRSSLAVVRAAMDAVARRDGRPSVFLHVWDNPLLAIGGASYLSELVEVAGGHNIYADLDQPSPQVSFEDLARRDPTVILAGPVEVPRLRSEARWQGLRAVRTGRVLAYDTTLVSRPSLRLGEAARALAHLLHPTARLPWATP